MDQMDGRHGMTVKKRQIQSQAQDGIRNSCDFLLIKLSPPSFFPPYHHPFPLLSSFIINTSIMNGYSFEISGKLHSVASSTLGYSLQVKIPFNATICGFLI